MNNEFTLDRYQKSVVAGISIKDEFDSEEHCAMGLAAESGEVLDLFKKSHYTHVERLDHKKVVEELGDVLWYLTYLAHSYGMTIEDLAKTNYKKLEKRYPERYPYLSCDIGYHYER